MKNLINRLENLTGKNLVLVEKKHTFKSLSKNLLKEGMKEKATEKLLSNIVKNSPWKGKAFIAGGYVRDGEMGLDPKDIDITVAAPNGGVELATYVAKKLGVYKKDSNPVIFPKFGTAKITLIGVEFEGEDLSDMDIEFVMTRKEKYNDNSRNPEIEYGTIEQDVERRDFTVNSLLKDLTTGEILDLTGTGKKDIKTGLVRTPLNPDVIFTEDPLRMLRGIRFTVKYGWKLPFFMIKSIKKNADQLSKTSKERIRVELDKMLTSPYPAHAIKLLQITGLSKHIFPELDKLIRMKQNKYHDFDAMKHTLEVVKQIPPNIIHRLAALFHDIGKGETKEIINKEIHFYKHEEVSAELVKVILKRLKYPNEIIDAVSTVVRQHMRTKQWGNDPKSASKKALRKLKVDLGDHLELTLDLIDADNKSHGKTSDMPDQVTRLKTQLQDIETEKSKVTLPINGEDIMKLTGISPGPEIGKLLKLIEEEWYENPDITKKEALEIISQTYK
jgi:poly(A) polymerase